MLFSYNYFKKECEGAFNDDDNYEPECQIKDALRGVSEDILETEEIRYTNMMKTMADNMHSTCSLVFSRDVPTLSMEILGIPYKKHRNENEPQWLRFEIYQLSNSVKIDVVSPDPTQFDFFYSVTID